MVSNYRPDQGSGRSIMAIVGVVVIISLVIGVYMGTGLSMTITDYDVEYYARENMTPRAVFEIDIKNSGVLTQSKIVTCELKTGDETYTESMEVTLGPGESNSFTMTILIPDLNVDDIEEKKCYTTLF